MHECNIDCGVFNETNGYYVFEYLVSKTNKYLINLCPIPYVKIRGVLQIISRYLLHSYLDYLKCLDI